MKKQHRLWRGIARDAMTRIAKHFHRKSGGNTLLFGRLMPSSIMNGARVAGETAAERLEALPGLKLEP